MTAGTAVPFVPADGVRARWRVLYDLLLPLGEGDVLLYTDIAEALGVSVDDRQVWQSAIRRAAKQFALEEKHAIRCVPHVGYRVLPAREHLSLAREQQSRARRALGRGREVVENVDLSALSSQERGVFESQARVFREQAEFVRRASARRG
jgi:alkylated DNA nucleotide flippase Atl1